MATKNDSNLGHDGASLGPGRLGGQEALLGVGPSNPGRASRPDVPADLAEDGQAAAEARLPDARDRAPPSLESGVELVQHRVAGSVDPAGPAGVFQRNSGSYAAVPETFVILDLLNPIVLATRRTHEMLLKPTLVLES